MYSVVTTLNQALENQATALPEKTFISSRGEDYSYAQVHDLVGRHAGFLLSLGVGQGDRVCLMLPRTPELIIAFLAATKIGALPVPVNYLLAPDTVFSFIQSVNPRVIVSHDKLVSAALAELPAGAGQPLCIDVAGRINNWLPWRYAFAGQMQASHWMPGPEDLAYLNFTTGSSGQPKGARATHANIYWNTRAAVDALSLGQEDVHLCMFAAFAHPHELFARALLTGASLVLQEELNPRRLLATIRRHGVTCLMGLAPMYAMMASHCGGEALPSLRIAESGGMYTRPEINEHFLGAFGRPILSVWGSTETTGIALANRTDSYRTDGTMGMLCPHYQARLVNEAGEEIAPGEIGELCLQGPGMVGGYEGEVLTTDQDGWYLSGDMASRDEDGFYYFAGRKSEMIKVAGLKVHPTQIELLLLTHPAIAEAAVLGMPDRRKGAVAQAFLVAKPGQVLDQDDIVRYCKDRVPSYMVPKRIEVRDSLPKIGSGKINKKLLQET